MFAYTVFKVDVLLKRPHPRGWVATVDEYIFNRRDIEINSHKFRYKSSHVSTGVRFDKLIESCPLESCQCVTTNSDVSHEICHRN